MMYKTIGPFEGEYAFLSNFYHKPFKWSTWEWETAEHAYQASKCDLIYDFLRIKQAPSPGKAKRLGQTVKQRSNFEIIRVDIMFSILKAKFADKELQKLLLDTEDYDIIEINDWNDEFWGVCGGKGLNNLGHSLERVREYYRLNTIG